MMLGPRRQGVAQAKATAKCRVKKFASRTSGWGSCRPRNDGAMPRSDWRNVARAPRETRGEWRVGRATRGESRKTRAKFSSVDLAPHGDTTVAAIYYIESNDENVVGPAGLEPATRRL